jgi:hypothetical protein
MRDLANLLDRWREEDARERVRHDEEDRQELAQLQQEYLRLEAAVSRKERQARMTSGLSWKRYGF